MTGSTGGTDLVRRHYAPDGDDETLVSRVAHILEALPDGPVTTSQLARLDQFHVGGLAATAALAEFAGVRRGSDVLDAGSGLGGPSRYLADVLGCRVVGIDLVPSYVALARLLADRTGLSDRVHYAVGDLARLPFDHARFDIVWTQHVVMNVRDREQVSREFRRVLKPNGTLAFYDVLAGDGHPGLLFPVPWAESAATSVLLTAAETAAVLTRVGLTPRAWRDVTADAITSLTPPRPPSPPGPPGLSLATVMGPRFGDMTANLARNLREGRVRLVLGCCDAAGA